ncbi:hypothetical protein BC939DRAFT_440300 [Gamsiella multidivaricata]|uniref:uncharacterized protein n=1 Tax=Gamsiella multidivaricata TaxID=101098 RepID=UPI0022201000|nr:uncharacterized protein BC939DRAFT_440300 [Gamsiella multidivaricata]KAI7829711.1 hypothetical protein BC939DRAFT_440300 [Gamsiella multidivaricata]
MLSGVIHADARPPLQSMMTVLLLPVIHHPSSSSNVDGLRRSCRVSVSGTDTRLCTRQALLVSLALQSLSHSPTLSPPKNQMMTNSIFDIPEIDLHITRHLEPADLASACRVSHHWLVLFASELWRSIELDQGSHRAFRRALPRYLRFVREPRCSKTFEFGSLGLCFTGLTLFGVYSLDRSSYLAAKQILQLNSNIEKLTLSCANMVGDTPLMMEIIRAIAEMDMLKDLSLVHSTPPLGALTYLLEQLPWLKTFHVMSTAATKSEASIRDTFGQYPQCQLRSLFICNCQDKFEGLHRIVQHASLLELLPFSGYNYLNFHILPQVEQFCRDLRSSCPHLNQLLIYRTEINLNALECLFTAFPRMKRLEVVEILPLHNNFLAIILRQEALRKSLEGIEITDYFYPPRPVSSPEVLELLRTFKRLKRVSLSECAIVAEELIQQGVGLHKEIDRSINRNVTHPYHFCRHAYKILGRFSKTARIGVDSRTDSWAIHI